MIEGITGRADDRCRVLYNEKKYGVVSLLSYGVAVVDLKCCQSARPHLVSHEG